MLTTHHLQLPHRSVAFRFDDQGGRDHIANTLSRDGLAAYERPSPSLFALLASSATAAILDVGANTGLYSLLAAAANPHVPIFAFEPLADAAAGLGRNLAANADLASRIRVESVALSRARGEAAFFETVNDQGLISTSSSLEAGFAATTHALVEQRTVLLDTLDQWSADVGLGAISLLKIDVEGHERAVFEGAGRLLRVQRPIIFVELLGGADFDFFERLLAEVGYQDVCPNARLARWLRTPTFMADGWNHVFCPLERVWILAQACCALGLGLA